MDTSIKRIKRINSHAGHARFLMACHMTSKRIPRQDIPSPYAYSPDHTLFIDGKGRDVFIVETAHKQYDVFLSPFAAVGKWESIKNPFGRI
jgi:hypothetical protein